MTPIRTLGTPAWHVLLADIVSWGFAAAVFVVAFTTEISFAFWQAAVLAGLFLVLRALAHEVRREHKRVAAHNERKRLIISRQT